MHMIDSMLLVKELNAKLFDNTISDHYLQAALICPTASMEHDYERQELLGTIMNFLRFTFAPHTNTGSI